MPPGADEQPERPWWEGAVVYQIYPLSFCLADPDGRRARLERAAEPFADRLVEGAGDLEGIRRHLDHVASLGADAIWLSPFYPSPMADLGYDVSDYCDVSPLFGDLDGFDRLVAEAHGLGLKVLVDWVPNHTSDRHPWFLDARRSAASAHRDFYIWRDRDDSEPARPPNNWRRAFGEGPAWTFDDATGQWYLHLFLPGQPDLNWANAAVAEAMEEVLDFWLDHEVDGFRIDVAHALGKPDGLPDAPAGSATIPYSSQIDDRSTHEILRRLRRHTDRAARPPLLLGEVFLLETAKVAPYYGEGDELQLAFNFTPMYSRFSASSFRRRLTEIGEHLGSRGAVPTWVLSSHDASRHRSRYGGSMRRARAAAVLSLAMRGTVFLYAGEELGLEDAVVEGEAVLDPGGRDGCRAPIPWSPAPEHGWSLRGAAPFLPFPPEADRLDVETESSDPASMLALYRELTALRRRSPALRLGDLVLEEAGDDEVLAFSRSEGAERCLVLVNFAGSPRQVSLGHGLEVAACSGGDSGRSSPGGLFPGELGPEEAVICSWPPPGPGLRG